ncbi:hypothetical protein AGABI1DRAFT_42300 [Agaricus bisporus var. burnettii JB137-S8]|uniref:Uncharacterized protein n=1 Tax=Agaricus bisporus var. burnettii (strain JB137-S8 / ATCC MYA-4627 / FGSC 10392) TaxID=597362 RepID=K5X4Q2_AGABU|nr:uncharacterized protein AGABI1DRAFT_42300 [Agaricus bisporus var. burnettii JB137-S8]EKM77927.1 hypothetical protein AGABI1DRAFT_42300 [Agaricus bisporus var. burnettii JB137-S8]
MNDIPEVDTIYTEYHPSSGLAPKLMPLEDHNRKSFPNLVPETRPWEPFRTRIDFEALELAMEIGLNKKQLARYIALLHRAQIYGTNSNEEDKFTVRDAKEAMSLWDLAAHHHESTPREFEFKYRDPWEWALQIVKEPTLKNHIVWDPERNYRWTGEAWEHFYDEPWSGEAWWRAQGMLPSHAPSNSKLIGFILYADKSKLSSFGSAMGHPIIARLGNLPVEIRNTDGILGGGCIVGWLPIVKEETSETGKTGFVNFKNAVYHEAFKAFLQNIVLYSHIGSNTKCGDGQSRVLWPFVLILSADYEEFMAMALLRGLKGNFPCPICLVPRESQWDLSQSFSLRTENDSKNQFIKAMNEKNLEKRDKILKERSIRPIENTFWSINLTDIHLAISYDCLHSDDNGLWEDHFFPLFKLLIKDIGRKSTVAVDNCFSSVPRWSNLNHFESVMNITFNDGSKNRDISKIFLYAVQSELTRDCNSEGYYLLRCLRYYLNIRMYTDFNLHTEGTLSIAEAELNQKFHPALLVYQQSQSQSINPQKSWNFPKIHLRKHLFRDIYEKGVTRSYSTKPNEKMHGPIRKIYLRRTNFKDFDDQILEANHHISVAGIIRSKIDTLDSYIASKMEEENPMGEVDQQYTDYRKLASPKPTSTLQSFEASYQSTPAFQSFGEKLSKFLRQFLPRYDIPVPYRNFKLSSLDEITEYQYLRVTYTCSADWVLKTDHLRCNPNFFGHPCYDSVIINGNPDIFFAQLLALFTVTVNGTKVSLAYVQPYEPLYRLANRAASDTELELLRLRKKPAKDAMFISVYSIIRGAVLIPLSGDGTSGAEKYFVFDLLDCDMFERCREILKKYGYF